MSFHFNIQDHEDTIQQAVNSLIQDDLDDDSEVTLHHVTTRGGNSMHSRHIRSVNARKMKETEGYNVSSVSIDSAIRHVLKVKISHFHFCPDCDFQSTLRMRLYHKYLILYSPQKANNDIFILLCARI